MKIKDRDGIILIPRYLECRYISKSYASHVLDSANTVALGKIRKSLNHDLGGSNGRMETRIGARVLERIRFPSQMKLKLVWRAR